MKKLLMPVMALLLIVQSSYLLAAADGDDYFRQARQAADMNRWKDVYKLIDDGNIDVNEHPPLGQYRLITTAIAYNKLEAVQELLKRGAELNIQVGDLPLMKASHRYLRRGDNMPTIELLLQSGAEPNFGNIKGFSTFDSVNNWFPLPWEDTAEHAARKQKLIELFEETAGKNIKGSEE